MKQTLIENKGLPTSLLWALAIIAGITVANLYYNQPLLYNISQDLQVSEFKTNLIAMVTQIGYALGLLFIIPLGDLSPPQENHPCQFQYPDPAGIISGILLFDVGMQCIQLSNQTTIFSLNPKASNRINTIFMPTYFAGGSLGTFPAGSFWSLYGWNGVAGAGLILIGCSFLLNLYFRKEIA